jgi:hypothetical protein
MNIDASKLAKIQEATGWLKQAEIYYKGLRFDIGDDCVKRARGVINDPVFDRQPIPGFAQNQQPDVVRIQADNPMGFAIINSEDFIEGVHQLYVEPTPPASGKRSK